MAGHEGFRIEVACVVRDGVEFLHASEVPPGTTARGAIERSRLQDRHPEVDLMHWRVGIFGHLVSLDHLLMPGDRVEVYQPLRADPKELRRRRALARK